MKHQAINLVKFKALSQRLRFPMWQAVGLLESLWLFCQHNCRDGVVSKFTALEVAAWMDYDGDADELIEKLIQTRWLDRDDDGKISVHDWVEHRPNWLKGIEAPLHPRQTKAKPSLEPPSLTLSSLPIPNQTKPTPTKPAGAGEGWECVVAEVLGEGVVAAHVAVEAARENGASTDDVLAIVAHFRDIRRLLDRPEPTLFARIKSWHDGQQPSDGWPKVKRPLHRYHEAAPMPTNEDKAAIRQPISEYLTSNDSM